MVYIHTYMQANIHTHKRNEPKKTVWGRVIACHVHVLEARRMCQIPLELLLEVALSHLT